MKNKNLTLNQKIIVEIINTLKENFEGRKKLMKLMFLFQHYDFENDCLKEKEILDSEFIIYHYGVFSFEIMDDYISLVNRGIIKEHPFSIVQGLEYDLDQEITQRIISLLERFGGKHGFELESDTLELLGLDLETKRHFFTEPVTKFI